MKKISILLLILTLWSCNDALEITQKGELNDERLFTNVANLQLYLNETYDRFSTQNEIVISSQLSDEVSMGNSLVTNDTQRFFMVSTNGGSENIWGRHYQAINYCNRLITGAGKFTPAASELAQYNSIVAQARAIRAFCHFQLLCYFSTDISNDSAPGVMKLDFVPSILQKVPRSSNGEVFALITADLAFAESNLGTPFAGSAPAAPAERYRYINQNFIDAFRARMFLYRKNYVQAEFFADKIITTSGIQLATSAVTIANFPSTSAAIIPLTGSNTIEADPTVANPTQRALWQFSLWASTVAPPYQAMWADRIQGESLFSLVRLNNNTNFSSIYNTNGSYLTGAPLYDMGRNLFELYRNSLGGGAEDIRRWSFIDRSSTISTTPATATRLNEVIVINKYVGKAGSHTSNDLKLFRLSEIYFIKAECRAKASAFAAAANWIRQVRQARSYTGGTVPMPVYANSTEAYADILLERRKELCFEGHRYLDLKRIGADAGVTGTDRFAQDAVNSSATNPVNINLGDYRFTLPIPQAEINVNVMQQNPGY